MQNEQEPGREAGRAARMQTAWFGSEGGRRGESWRRELEDLLLVHVKILLDMWFETESITACFSSRRVCFLACWSMKWSVPVCNTRRRTLINNMVYHKIIDFWYFSNKKRLWGTTWCETSLVAFLNLQLIRN